MLNNVDIYKILNGYIVKFHYEEKDWRTDQYYYKTLEDALNDIRKSEFNTAPK